MAFFFAVDFFAVVFFFAVAFFFAVDFFAVDFFAGMVSSQLAGNRLCPADYIPSSPLRARAVQERQARALARGGDGGSQPSGAGRDLSSRPSPADRLEDVEDGYQGTRRFYEAVGFTPLRELGLRDWEDEVALLLVRTTVKLA